MISASAGSGRQWQGNSTRVHPELIEWTMGSGETKLVRLVVTPCDGCVTCHTRHASVTDFRPIWGNTVEATHMTSSVMYINSHAKGTSLPLSRITTMIPLFKPLDSLADPVTARPAQCLTPSLLSF